MQGGIRGEGGRTLKGTPIEGGIHIRQEPQLHEEVLVMNG